MENVPPRNPHQARGWGEGVWRLISLAVAWAVGTLSMTLALRTEGRPGTWIAAASVALALICTASGLLRPLLLDLFAQFHYKEKFALFLAHLVVLISPLAVARERWFLTGLVLVLLSVGLQLVSAVNFHRFLALCAALVVMGLWKTPPGAVTWALGWAFLAGMFLVVERVRFALEDLSGPPPLVPAGPVIRAVVVYVGLPILAAGAVAWLYTPKPPARPQVTRVEKRSPRYPTPLQTPGPTVKELMWESLALAVGISVAIALLYWYSSVQSRKKARQPPIEELVVGAETELVNPPSPPPELDPLRGKEPRLEILRQFRRLERALARLDLGRKKNWTVREYVHHLRATLASRKEHPERPPEPTPPDLKPEPEAGRTTAAESESTIVGVYEKVRYAQEDPSEGEVQAFRGAVGEIIDRSRSAPPPPDKEEK